ncbi:peptide ABC transporter substrate-binding protein, partial [Patescibacteria group bacterium]|nr:peptide ABC transporter substrate-binding protein [Patescibacteria group bacterium]
INPLLAISNADRDLSSLIYSGLMRAQPNGTLIYDLAESHSVSEDGLTYTFRLRTDGKFHDGEPVTSDDIVFTIKRVQDTSLKSPKRASWEGVTIESISEYEVRFTLEQPYAPFLENTTLGILPEHIWSDADSEQFTFSQFNIEPVGSGPYRISKIKKDESGIPVSYELKPFSQYTLGRPNISSIIMRFYSNENQLVDAYLNKEISAFNSVTSKNLALVELNTKSLRIERVSLPRIFAVFFNQNQAPVLANKEVREAFNITLDRKRLIKEVLGGNGIPINGPIPPGIIRPSHVSTQSESEIAPRSRAIKLLEKNKWRVNEESGIFERKTKGGVETLTFSLATSDVPELKAAAQIIVQEWNSIGADVNLKIFEMGDLNQNVIRPRKYDALFFGEIVGRELDLFAFWHSSQRNDPGLNIALYANITADKLLEDVRTITDYSKRMTKYREFEQEIAKDIPAIFVYSPDFIYIVPKNINGLKLGSVTTPNERFLNVYQWYIETDSVWSFFAR